VVSGGVPTEFGADPTEILTSFPKVYLGFSGRTLEVNKGLQP